MAISIEALPDALGIHQQQLSRGKKDQRLRRLREKQPVTARCDPILNLQVLIFAEHDNGIQQAKTVAFAVKYLQ